MTTPAEPDMGAPQKKTGGEKAVHFMAFADFRLLSAFSAIAVITAILQSYFR